MPELIAIAITKKDYRGRSIARGRSIPKMIEDAMRGVLKSVEQSVKAKLPSKRMRAGTKIYYNPTPKGASASFVVGAGVPFARIQAKWDDSPTIILPKKGKYLAIPLNAFAKGLQGKSGPWDYGFKTLWSYGPILHPRWYGKGQRGRTLFYGEGKKPMFRLVHSATVYPSVNLSEVKETMRYVVAASLKRAFTGYDFGYVSLRGVR